MSAGQNARLSVLFRYNWRNGAARFAGYLPAEFGRKGTEMGLSGMVRRGSRCAVAALVAVAFLSRGATPVYAQRVFGLDTSSAANTNVSQAQWNAAFTSGWAASGIPSFQFAFVRSNHGIPATGGTDDNQVWQNIARATSAGMLVGTYNYDDADSNTGAVEANYYISRVGMYMKPGYLLPVLDLEAGAGQTQAALTQWSLDYINTIFAAKGINPIVYTNSSYNNDEVTAAVAFTNIASSPHTGNRTYQWLARPSGSLTTGQPIAAAGYPDPYGGWDPNFTTKAASIDPAVKPWAFWQNGSAHIDPSGPSGQQFLVDFDAANGNIEYVKDFLVPALWTNAGSGDWNTISNWNSDNPGYVAGNVNTGPAPRLPNNSNLDWVKLQNSGGGTVTISSGAQTVRKFYTQQPLNISGGSLSVSYIPGSGGQFDVPSEFNNTVTLAAGAAYSAHTTQIDSGGRFNINGGTVTFRSINLASNASNPGKIVMGGDVTLTPSTLGGTGTAVIRSTGSLAQAGTLDLGGASRKFTINDGTPLVDVTIQAAVTGAGGLTKAGAGTLQLAGFNSYSGGTIVSAGLLSVSGASATLGTGNVTVQGTTAGTSLTIENGVGDAIDDGATLSLMGGGVADVADQGYANLGAGINEFVHALSLSGVTQSVGTYGATGSGATHISDEYFAGTGIVSVVSLAGDYNVDGVVDMADYVLWRANVGHPAGTLVNDTTGAVVGEDQYNLWRSNFGNQLGSGSGSQVSGAAVPELSSIGLMMFGLAALVGRRRRR